MNKKKVSRNDDEVDSDCGDGKGENVDVLVTKDREKAWTEAIEAAELVGEATITPSKEGEGFKKTPDLGYVYSITGTPSRNTPCMTSTASPILSKSSKKPMSQC